MVKNFKRTLYLKYTDETNLSLTDENVKKYSGETDVTINIFSEC